MLLLSKEKNGKYIEVRASAWGGDYYLILIYDCTPNGRIYEKSAAIEKDVFDLITD